MLDLKYRMAGRDGTWRWVWEQEVSLPGDEGSQGVVLDITALHEAREALQATQDRLGMMVNSAPVILFATDAAGTITVSEGRGLEALGFAPGELVGTSIFDFTEAASYARRALAGESFESCVQFGEGNYDCSWRGLADGSMIGIAIDVSARRRSEERLAHLAFHDPLTGLPNRATVEEQLGRELSRAVRDRSTVGALYIDLDQFKLVNDSLGHAAGDRVLVEVAERIRA